MRSRAARFRVGVVPRLGILHSIQRQQHVASVLRALPGGCQCLLRLRFPLLRRLDVFVADVVMATLLAPLQLRQLVRQVVCRLLGVQRGYAGLPQLLRESPPDNTHTHIQR